ncbi:MAG TPA: SDR family oxidoreductase [Anaerolineales bacterium]|jgi:dTDP-4-dehydrorhamnose reductase
MKLLVMGASGLLGLNLALEAMNGHDVVAVDRGRLVNPPFQVLKTDLLTDGALDSVLRAAEPDWLINCAALAGLDACEADPELARRLNTELPGDLATVCARRKVAFIHISTDAVFDGHKEGFYTESEEAIPTGVYSQTKLDGERAVLEANPAAIVARVNFYGWSLGGKRSLAEFFLNNLMNGKSMSGFTDVTFCPQLVNDLARLLLQMLQKGLSGLYHVVGPQAMSKYQFGVEIARKFGLRESEISPKSILSASLTARRSHNLSLSTHKLSTDLGMSLPGFSTGLEEFFAQYQQGYPQKIQGYQQAAK